MAQLNPQDVMTIWNQLKPASWAGLAAGLESENQRADKVEAQVTEEVVNDIVRVSRELDQAGEDYPGSPEELCDVLNEHMGR